MMGAMFTLGYNTNGFAHHRLEDAVEILFDIGYRSLALTPDFQHLDPFEADWRRQAEQLRARMGQLGMGVTVETGARFLLDPRRKHQPTLVSASAADRAVRLSFLERCCEMAELLGADVLSLWSGTCEDNASFDEGFSRLVDGLRRLLDSPARKRVRLAFEPEPGMLVETMEQFAQLAGAVDHPDFGLTLDLGHLHCLGDDRLEEHIERYGQRLWNVHIEDMKQGVHDHLMFGEGTMDFARIFRGLRRCGYSGPVHVELSRHSHNAVDIARRSFAFLNKLAEKGHGATDA